MMAIKQETRKLIWKVSLIVILAALAAWFNSPQRPEISVGAFERNFDLKLGLDLQGGTQLTYRANVSGISEEEAGDAVTGVRDVIERRVNAFGISEPIVQTTQAGDEYRMIVELAGVHDPEEAIALIGATPQLDFRREIIPDGAEKEALNINELEGSGGFQFERTGLTGKHLRRATVDFDPTFGSPQVSLEFDGEGSDLFAQLTRESLGKRIAIYLDGIPISAPVVQQEITNGRAVISGGFTIEEANDLARSLRAGALPVPIELIGQLQLGPSLGRMSLQESYRAGLIGFAAVAAWMILFYRAAGAAAAGALALYAGLFLVLLRLVPVTLTLAGVAGVVLSLGMAVDANVLIFERIKENVRAKKNLRFAIENGFNEAWDSIKSSNVSSLITAVILYYFGTSLIRGFALTFGLGILLSMFTAIVVVRSVLPVVLTKRGRA